MADNSTAATATASASPAGSAPGTGAAPTSERKPVLAPELSASPSFDVEEFLAAQEAGPSTSETKGAETTGDATSETAETQTDETATAESDGEGEGESTEEPSQDENETASDTEAQAEDDDAAPEGLKPKAVKRFNKLLEQRDAAKAAERAAKEELASLKAQLEARQDEPTPVKADADPLAQITNDEQLEAYEAFYDRVKAWCRRNPHGGTPPKELTGGVEQEFDVEGVVSSLEQAERMLESLPKRREFLRSYREAKAKAKEAYKPVFTPGTAENALAESLRPRLLNFRSQADQDALLAKLVKAELMEREERDGVARYTRVELKNGKPAAPITAKPVPKPALTRTIVPPVKAASNGTKTDVMTRLRTSGESIDAEEFLDAA
jgi:hypothetical protein